MPFGFGHGDSAKVNLFGLGQPVALGQDVSAILFGHSIQSQLIRIRPPHSYSARPLGLGQTIRTRPFQDDSAILFGLGHDTRMLVAVACIHATSPC